jgi:predicted acetyltransferase
MYVVRIDNKPIGMIVYTMEKKWSQTMMTHEIHELDSKRFVLRMSANRWIRKQITKYMFEQHELEIIDG